ncbi:MAG: hypothetical protein ACK5Q5_20035 [Planctomycetaceae bacterium]
MNITLSLHTDMRDLLFADWAELVAFLEVSLTYDPLTGQVAESSLQTDLLAVVGPELNSAEPDTAQQHTQRQRTFLIRAEDLPAEASFATSRIRCRGQDYAVTTVDHAPHSNLLVFHALARA